MDQFRLTRICCFISNASTTARSAPKVRVHPLRYLLAFLFFKKNKNYEINPDLLGILGIQGDV